LSQIISPAWREGDDQWILQERTMSKADHRNAVYRVTEVVGTSQESWEDAAKNAVRAASKSLRDLRIAEVMKLDVKIEDGEVATFRARLALSFKYET
jgi:flavin-binding protein dodecin